VSPWQRYVTIQLPLAVGKRGGTQLVRVLKGARAGFPCASDRRHGRCFALHRNHLGVHERPG
jgi:hypothetical protein